MPPRRSGRRISVAPPQPPAASAPSSRQVSPVIAQRQPNYIRHLHNALNFGVRHVIPIGVSYVIGKYGKPIYNTLKDLANYGKRMSINALAAIRSTPYKDIEQSSSPTPPLNGTPTPTPLPKPTLDKHHPRTSLQIYNDL